MPSSTLQLLHASVTSEPRYYGQILATLAIALGPFAAGLGKGYSSPALASLQSLNTIQQQQQQQLHVPTPSPFDRMEESSQWDNSSSLLSSSASLAASAVAATVGTAGFSVSNQEGSWIASLSLLGALFGAPVGGMCMRAGRKKTLLAFSIPFGLFWLLTVFAGSVSVMYVTAFGCGFCSAIILLVSNVYISEIASPEIRGGLCALSKMSSHCGLLVSFSLGAFLDWRRLAMVATAAPITFFIAAFYVPETPSCLLLKGREEDAALALQWLRGENTDISQEWNTMQTNIRRQKSRVSSASILLPTSSLSSSASASSSSTGSSSSPSLFWRQKKKLLRPLLITCGVMLFARLSGAHAFNFYAVPIFRASFAGSLDAHAAAIIVAFVQLLASITSGLLIDQVGRLPLLIVSSSLMTVALAGFGSFIFIVGGKSAVGDVLMGNENLDWIPLVCVLIFTVAFSVGVGPIAWLLISELYPLEFRGVGSAITSAFSYLCAFVSVKTFVDLEAAFGLHGAFWIYAFVSFLGLVFVMVFVPETKNKVLEEMTETSRCHLNT